jgi:hypothetical protein
VRVPGRRPQRPRSTNRSGATSPASAISSSPSLRRARPRGKGWLPGPGFRAFATSADPGPTLRAGRTARCRSRLRAGHPWLQWSA